jgi:hypothetical protein
MVKIRYYFTIKNSHDEHIDVKFQSSHDVPINCYMTIASAELTLNKRQREKGKRWVILSMQESSAPQLYHFDYSQYRRNLLST